MKTRPWSPPALWRTLRPREKLHRLVRLRFSLASCHVGLGDVSNDEGQQTSTRSEGRDLPKGWRVLQETGGLQGRAFWTKGAGWNFELCGPGIHPRPKRMLHCLPTARAGSIARFSPCGAGPKRENDRRQLARPKHDAVAKAGSSAPKHDGVAKAGQILIDPGID